MSERSNHLPIGRSSRIRVRGNKSELPTVIDAPLDDVESPSPTLTESSTALVLAAHGASDDPRCAAPVERHAEAILEMNRFGSVHTIYWKQPPFFREVYDVVASRDLLIVPVMTASGYYTNTVLPREIRLDDPSHDRRVRVAQAIGEQRAMADLVEEQAMRALAQAAIKPASARVLLIGHGTWRDPVRSGATTHRHAKTLRERGRFRDVHVGFLEQDPTVPYAFAAIPGDEPVVIVPYLIASGGHGADDIPESLSAAPEARQAAIDGRTVLFADAVGEHERTVELILEAANAALCEKSEEPERSAV